MGRSQCCAAHCVLAQQQLLRGLITKFVHRRRIGVAPDARRHCTSLPKPCKIPAMQANVSPRPAFCSQVKNAIDDGFDVRGFMYWTLIDNFEWNFAWVRIFFLLGNRLRPEVFPSLAPLQLLGVPSPLYVEGLPDPPNICVGSGGRGPLLYTCDMPALWTWHVDAAVLPTSDPGVRPVRVRPDRGQPRRRAQDEGRHRGGHSRKTLAKPYKHRSSEPLITSFSPWNAPCALPGCHQGLALSGFSTVRLPSVSLARSGIWRLPAHTTEQFARAIQKQTLRAGGAGSWYDSKRPVVRT